MPLTSPTIQYCTAAGTLTRSASSRERNTTLKFGRGAEVPSIAMLRLLRTAEAPPSAPTT